MQEFFEKLHFFRDVWRIPGSHLLFSGARFVANEFILARISGVTSPPAAAVREKDFWKTTVSECPSVKVSEL
jgi:hypothetical protein